MQTLLNKLAAARWRTKENLPKVVKRMLPTAPASSGEAKVRLGQLMKGEAPAADPVLHSLSRLPGAGPIQPTQQAMNELGKMQPSLWRRFVEGSGLARERQYPGFRAQTMPFTGKRVDTGYANSDNMNIMHVAPRLGGTSRYFQQADGALPGYASVGAFNVPVAQPWYSHGGARSALLGGTPKPVSRHALDAYETAIPPQLPARGFFGSQKLKGGLSMETTNMPSEKLEAWYRSFSQPLQRQG